MATVSRTLNPRGTPRAGSGLLLDDLLVSHARRRQPRERADEQAAIEKLALGRRGRQAAQLGHFDLTHPHDDQRNLIAARQARTSFGVL